MYAVEWLEKLEIGEAGFIPRVWIFFLKRVGNVRITFYSFEESSV